MFCAKRLEMKKNNKGRDYLKELSDELLVYTYFKSLELGLSDEFITLLREEIEDRNICIENIENREVD
jgi:hypothetical protein